MKHIKVTLLAVAAVSGLMGAEAQQSSGTRWCTGLLSTCPVGSTYSRHQVTVDRANRSVGCLYTTVHRATASQYRVTDYFVQTTAQNLYSRALASRASANAIDCAQAYNSYACPAVQGRRSCVPNNVRHQVMTSTVDRSGIVARMTVSGQDGNRLYAGQTTEIVGEHAGNLTVRTQVVEAPVSVPQRATGLGFNLANLQESWSQLTGGEVRARRRTLQSGEDRRVVSPGLVTASVREIGLTPAQADTGTARRTHVGDGDAGVRDMIVGSSVANIGGMDRDGRETVVVPVQADISAGRVRVETFQGARPATVEVQRRGGAIVSSTISVDGEEQEDVGGH